MAQGNKLQIKDTALVSTHSTHADSVSSAQIAIQSRLRPVVLIEDLDGRVGRRGASQLLGLGDVCAESSLALFRRGRRLALELEAHTGSVTVHDSNTVARRRDTQARLLNKGSAPIVNGAEDLPGLRLELVLLTLDKGHDIVHDVHAGHARVSRARDGLHGDDADGGDGAEGGLEGGEGDNEPDDGAVGVADEEALGQVVDGSLVGDEVEVREVDGGHDERDEGIAAVVFGVGEDGDFGLEEGHFWFCSVSLTFLIA